MYKSPSSHGPVSLVSGVKQYGSSYGEERRASYGASAIRWLQLKKYQYEVTWSLYMLTPMEKFVFNLTLFILIAMLAIATTFYLPNHILIVYNRVCYYVEGSTASSSLSEMAKTTVDAFSPSTASAMLQRGTEHVLKEL